MLRSAPSLIRELRLEPHPEGGAYREVFRSSRGVRTPRGDRPAATAIAFLLAAGEFSHWHRVASCEWWHLHDGDPVELTCLSADGEAIERRILDRSAPLAEIPAGRWQTARCLGDWSLAGCTVSPGFDFEDFALMRDLPDAVGLARRHPELARWL